MFTCRVEGVVLTSEGPANSDTRSRPEKAVVIAVHNIVALCVVHDADKCVCTLKDVEL